MTPRIAWLLPLSGILFLVGIAVRGPFHLPDAVEAATFDAAARHATFLLGSTLNLAGFAVAPIGWYALHRETPSRATAWGAGLLYATGALLIWVVGALTFTWPRGHAVAAEAFADPWLQAPFYLTAITYLAGVFLFAVARWRTNARWAMPVLGVGVALLATAFTWPLELAGAALFTVGAVWLVRAPPSTPAHSRATVT